MAKKSGFILSKDLEQKTQYVVPKLTMPVSTGTKVAPASKLSDADKEKAGRTAMEKSRLNAPKEPKSNIPPLLSALISPRNPYTEGPVIKAPKQAEVAAKKFLSSATLGLTDVIPTRYARGVEEQAKIQPVTSVLGSVAGYVAPGALGAKLVKPLIKKVTSKLGKQALEGAVVGTGITATENIVPLLKGEKDIKQVGKEIGTGLILGAAADVGLNKIGKLAKPLLDKISNGQALSQAEKNIVAKQANVSVDNVDNVVEKYRTTLSRGDGLTQQPIKPLLSDAVTPQQQINPLLDITPTETQKDVTGGYVSLGMNKPESTINLQNLDSRKFYHGSGTSGLTPEKLTPAMTKIEGLFGSGIYVTDNPEIALGYAKARGKKTGKVSIYEMNLDNLNMIDLEKRLPEDVISDYQTMARFFDENYDTDIMNTVDFNDTGYNVYRKITEEMSGRVPRSEADESLTDLQLILKSKGYDGYEHIGGKLTGKDPHKVNIIFDPNDVYGVGRKNELRNFKETASADSVAFNVPEESTSIPLPKKSIESKIPQAEKPVFDKYRKTVHNSFMKSNMDDEAKEFFNSNPETYQQVSNQETWDKAYSKVAENFDDAKNAFDSKTSLETADDTAEAIAIMHKLSEQGKTGELIDFTKKMSEKATDAGRAVQAITLLQRSTPEGKLLQATNVVKNAIKQLEETDNALFEKLKKNGKLPKLTKEDADLILDTMRKAQDLEGREKQKMIAIADQLIADKIPVTLGDKIKAFRNLSLLGNPKTIAIRNPLGNLIFSGLENVSQIPSGITDKIVSAMLKTPRQTPILPSVGAQAKGFKKGVAEAWDDILNNVDTSPTRGGAELPRNRKVFETAWLNKANNWLGDSLKMGDRPFYQAAYEQRLSELKQLQPNAKIEDLEKLANEFGLERTFQNKSGLSEALKVIKTGAPYQEGKGGLNALNIKGVGLGDVIMPYTQTPANILSKGIEYTPLNIIKLAKIASGGKQNIAKNQKSFTDAVGRMFTGSGIAALGYSLASQGLITGKEQSTSGKVKALNKESGQQQYSIKIGDTWYSFDWAQPASIPLALGVDFYNAGLKQEDVASKLAKGLTSAGDTLTNQGVLQGITRMFGGQSPTTGLVDSLAQFPSQFVPTLSSQTAQVSDKYKREADYSNLSSTAKTTVMKRIPVVRQKLEPSIDLYGEKALEQQGRPALEKAISVFLSPSLTSKETKDLLTKEIVRVYKSTNETGVIPKKDPPEGLTKQQETAFKVDMGKSVKPALSMMVNSSMYKSASDEKKAKLLERVINDVYGKVKDRHKPTKK